MALSPAPAGIPGAQDWLQHQQFNAGDVLHAACSRADPQEDQSGRFPRAEAEIAACVATRKAFMNVAPGTCSWWRKKRPEATHEPVAVQDMPSMASRMDPRLSATSSRRSHRLSQGSTALRAQLPGHGPGTRRSAARAALRRRCRYRVRVLSPALDYGYQPPISPIEGRQRFRASCTGGNSIGRLPPTILPNVVLVTRAPEKRWRSGSCFPSRLQQLPAISRFSPQQMSYGECSKSRPTPYGGIPADPLRLQPRARLCSSTRVSAATAGHPANRWQWKLQAALDLPRGQFMPSSMSLTPTGAWGSPAAACRPAQLRPWTPTCHLIAKGYVNVPGTGWTPGTNQRFGGSPGALTQQRASGIPAPASHQAFGAAERAYQDQNYSRQQAAPSRAGRRNGMGQPAFLSTPRAKRFLGAKPINRGWPGTPTHATLCHRGKGMLCRDPCHLEYRSQHHLAC